MRRGSTGDVVLSARPPATYAAFKAARDVALPLEPGFLSAQERAQNSETRDPFAGESAES